MRERIQKKRLVKMIALFLAFAGLKALSRIAPPAEFPDEIMGIDLVQSLDKTISDIDSTFESLKPYEKGIAIQMAELQKQIDRAVQNIEEEMKPGKRYRQIGIAASDNVPTGENWRDRVEHMEKQIKARREEREAK